MNRAAGRAQAGTKGRRHALPDDCRSAYDARHWLKDNRFRFERPDWVKRSEDELAFVILSYRSKALRRFAEQRDASNLLGISRQMLYDILNERQRSRRRWCCGWQGC